MQLYCRPLQMVTEPLMVPQILLRVGPAAMADWLLHLLGLAAYTFLDWDLKVRCSPRPAVSVSVARQAPCSAACAHLCQAAGLKRLPNLHPLSTEVRAADRHAAAQAALHHEAHAGECQVWGGPGLPPVKRPRAAVTAAAVGVSVLAQPPTLATVCVCACPLS